MYACIEYFIPQPLSVLVVDDESGLRESLGMLLQSAGYMVQSAANLTQARDALKKEHFDLVFLDMKLPDGTGSDLLPQISQISPAPRVVILSAVPSAMLRVEPQGEPISGYLEKPCDPKEIIQTARRVLRGAPGKQTALG